MNKIAQEKPVAVNPHVKPGDYYVLVGSGKRFTRDQLLDMTMKCAEGETQQYVKVPDSNALYDRKASRYVYARNDGGSIAKPSGRSNKIKHVTRAGGLMALAIARQGDVVHSDGDLHPQR